MKIALLSYGFLPQLGGGELFIYRLASMLSKNGNTVFIISNFEGPANLPKNCVVYKTPRLPSKFASMIAHILVAPLMLLLLNLVNGIDVIHSAGFMDLLSAFPCKLVFRVPVVLRLSLARHVDFIKRLKTPISIMADKIVVLHSNMRDELLASGLKNDKIVVINNGVDTDKFFPNSAAKQDTVILWVGRLHPFKEPNLAIETLSQIVDSTKKVQMHIVGRGKMEEQLRKLVLSYNLTDRIKFLGYQKHDAVAEIMGNADILLLTSKSEGMSNALLEAMSCGLAVLTTSRSSTGVVQNGINGFIVNDHKDMAPIVLRLIDDIHLRSEIGKNARNTVLKNFSVNQMFSKYLHLYERFILD